MNSKNQQLNTLFDNWSENYGASENFVKDGIIDEERFQNATHKILFITKEPNDPKNEATDYREWWNEELYYSFSYRIAEWAYGILNDFPVYDEIWPKVNGKYNGEKAMEAIQSIAFMNVKKSGGKGSSEEKTINRYIKRDYEFIHEQISVIDPEIIVISMSKDSTVNLLFPEMDWKESGYGTGIGRYENSKVIDFYHPSARSGVAAPYCLLQNIVQSKVFRDL